jgi:hypothetical protein
VSVSASACVYLPEGVSAVPRGNANASADVNVNESEPKHCR